MVVLQRVKKAIHSPDIILPFMKDRIIPTVRMLLKGKISLRMTILIVFEEFMGVNLYMRYLSWQSRDRLVIRQVHGHQMYLRVDDIGLSRDLAIYRTREELTARIFERELSKLVTELNGEVTAIECGANIGFYALLEARILDGQGKIYAFEPVPENIDLLNLNIGVNGYTGRVDIHQTAIGRNDGTETLQVTPESNLNRINTGLTEYMEQEDTITVSVRSIDSFIAEQGIDSEAVNVVRMDVEGYETEIVAGMKSILETDCPLLLFIELHIHLLSEDDLNNIINTLSESMLEIVSVVRGTAGMVGSEHPLNITSFDSLGGLDSGVRLILRR